MNIDADGDENNDALYDQLRNVPDRFDRAERFGNRPQLYERGAEVFGAAAKVLAAVRATARVGGINFICLFL
ncbi:hypothetical protein [Paraburkholderia aspalathi]|uniref:hypothetical protein n=1 Tax=Paraburkholderia aspalathi TaxID=1324617 RepID=UPI0038BBD05A